ncbi:glycosyltransferase family 4 protein [Thermoplasmatales archaeon AK]|nr:glycosyltransferase family 4 protein [Thermoplasmatales archaeon AK]
MTWCKIIIINESTRYSGLGRYAGDLTKALDADLISIRTDRNVPVQNFEGTVMDARNIPGMGSGWYFSHRFPTLALGRVARLLKELYQGCIIHYSSQLVPHFIGGEKTVTTVHDLFGIESTDDKRYKTLLTRQLEIIKNERFVVTVSNYMKKKLIERGIGSRVDVIYPAISHEFYPINDKRELRKKLGLPLEKKIILSVSSLDRRKNIATLIEARKKIDESFAFVHVGPAIQGFINFTNVDDITLNMIYNAADVLVLPSIDEGFGYPAVEALSTGLPVVASNVEIFREVIGDAGVLTEPDPKGVVEGILLALSSKEELIDKGFKRSSLFSKQLFEKRIKSYYSDIFDCKF